MHINYRINYHWPSPWTLLPLYLVSVTAGNGASYQMKKILRSLSISTPITKYNELDPALCIELRKIVEAITAPGKGLLASDESPASLDERFGELGIENTETTRQEYRQMLFSADKSELSQYIGGVILHHETVYQKTSDGTEFVEFLRQRNIVPGVKVDKGLVQLFGTQEENTTQGLDNLQERCIQYKKDGCHFTKWRCTFSISDTLPSQLTMITNAHVLARYATICQSARMVPIVEPELLNAGEHGINKAQQVQEEMLSILFRTLNEHHVYLEGMILKPAMVLSGINSTKNCRHQIVGEYTVTTLQRTVPPAVPAILFLSGGQSDEDAVLNLNAINTFKGIKPWRLSFCYGRALQNSAMQAWKGDPANVEDAQVVFLERARLCSEASLGQLQLDEENGSCESKHITLISGEVSRQTIDAVKRKCGWVGLANLIDQSVIMEREGSLRVEDVWTIYVRTKDKTSRERQPCNEKLAG